MITLSSTLEDAISGRSRTPAISLVHSHINRSVPQLHWQEFYNGSESDVPHAACITPLGTHIRVQNRSGTVYISRVTNASSASTYSSFSSMAGQAAASGQGIAIAAGPSTVIIAYVKSGSRRITIRRSTNDGATWSSGSDSNASNESSNIAFVAVGTEHNNDDDWFLCWDNGTNLRMQTSNNGGSTWNSVNTEALSASLSAFSGMAVAPLVDTWQLVICGYRPTTSDRFVDVVTRTPFGVFGDFFPVAEADANSGILSFSTPSIAVFNDETSLVTYAEDETGNVPYVRTFLAIGTPGAGNVGYFTEPQPLEALTVYGAQLAHHPAAALWTYSTCDQVWGATYDDAETELASRILSLHATLSQDGASLDAVLADDDPADFPVGSTLALRAGYHTSAGPEYGSTWTFEVTRSFYSRNNGRIEQSIHASGPWERAAATKSRQLVSAPGAAGSRAAFFARALARAGGIVVEDAPSPHAPGSDWTTDHSPDFYATPGTSFAEVARRLLQVAPEGLVFEGPTVYVRSVDPADASVASFAADMTEIPIDDVQIGENAQKSNWFRLSSADRYSDAHLSGPVAAVGPRISHLYDADADSNTKANEMAAGAAARARWSQGQAFLDSPWHPGLQLLDVVTVEDHRISLAPTNYRVLTLSLAYDRSGRAARRSAHHTGYQAIIELGTL